MDLLEKLKNHVDAISQSHLKYLNGQTVQENVLYTKIDGGGKDISEVCNYLDDEYDGKKLERDVIEWGLQAIINTFVELSIDIDIKLLVYDFLQKFYNQIDSPHNQNYLHQLLEIYFQKMHLEKPTLTDQIFMNLVSIISPYLKLELAIKQLRKGLIPSKESLKQLFECILYPKVSRDDCHTIIFNKIGTFNYELLKFVLKPLDDGWGILGDHFKLEITIKHEDMNKIHYFFMKFVPKGTGAWKSLALDSFKKEKFIYREMIPKIKEFGAQEMVNFAPKSYLLKENEVIVLENLTPLGFRYLEMTEFAKFEWIASVIEELSKFHCCSILLEQKLIKEKGKTVSLGNVYSEYLDEPIYTKNGLMGFSGGENFINEYFIEESAELWTEMSANDFKKKIVLASEKMFEDVRKSENFYNVICHGDLYGRNTLSNELQKKIYIIDFQLIRYCPPALDLLFLIYNNTSRQVRDNHMDEFIKIYYNSLKNNLDLYNVDINQFYTLENFYESTKYYKTSGIIIALAYLQYNLYPQESREEYDNSAVKIAKYYSEERSKPYKEKIRNLLVDLYNIYNKSDHK